MKVALSMKSKTKLLSENHKLHEIWIDFVCSIQLKTSSTWHICSAQASSSFYNFKSFTPKALESMDMKEWKFNTEMKVNFLHM
jgi:hypothetical protein